MIDLHCHVLAGIDDGPQTIEDSLALARVASSAGTRILVATPHVNFRYENRAETIAALVAQLNKRIAEEALELEIRAGAEVALIHARDLDAHELVRLRLGGGPWLLVEPPSALIAVGLPGMVRELVGQGHRVLLAHPERCPAFHRDPKMLASLVQDGALTSVTAASLRGRFGQQVRRFALELVREQLVHNVASDAHDHEHRPPTMVADLEQAGLGALAEWLTCAVPAAILAGGEIPARPAVAPAAGGRTRGGWLRAGRMLRRAAGRG